jgi:hypothetical protein
MRTNTRNIVKRIFIVVHPLFIIRIVVLLFAGMRDLGVAHCNTINPHAIKEIGSQGEKSKPNAGDSMASAGISPTPQNIPIGGIEA